MAMCRHEAHRFEVCCQLVAIWGGKLTELNSVEAEWITVVGHDEPFQPGR